MNHVEVIIIGAGAAGLMCAIEASKRHRRVMVIDHANKAGKKILMSGGGYCNFTNYFINPDNYISHNPHFCKSALNRYTQWDFIDLINRYAITFHEKKLGQLFCDNKAKVIVDMLLAECQKYNAIINLNVSVSDIQNIESNNFNFKVNTTCGIFYCQSLVIATGGLSIPTMGASGFAYKVADNFGIKVWPTRAGLVPFTLKTQDLIKFAVLSGIGIDSLVENSHQNFRENILFTHRGLSGPSILQISSYWRDGETITINLLPDVNLYTTLKLARVSSSQKQLHSLLSLYLPKRVIKVLICQTLAEKKLSDLSNLDLKSVAQQINNWTIKPNGTEGYKTAEVTLGGIDCDALSSKTMEVRAHKGLYFIGEAVDVTGWLGGFNFQWAWSSGWAAGQAV